MSSEKSNSGRVGFASLLGLAFIILKLCKAIDWSWWWVLSPFWIIGVMVILLLVIAGILAITAVKQDEPKDKSKWQQRLEEIQDRERQARQRKIDHAER
jgi:uncharacterized membrane protein